MDIQLGLQCAFTLAFAEDPVDPYPDLVAHRFKFTSGFAEKNVRENKISYF